MLPVTITQIPAGGAARDLTPTALRYSSSAVGGFGSCEFALEGDRRRDLGYLALVRLAYGPTTLWEGQLEDASIAISNGTIQTNVRAFGLQRKLAEVSLRRVWSKRDNTFTQGQLNLWTPDPAYDIQTGNFDATDLSKSGIRFMGNSTAALTAKANYWRIRGPLGLTLIRVMGTYQKAGSTNMHAQVWSSSDLLTYTNHLDTGVASTTDFSFALVASAVDVLFGGTTAVAFTPTNADFVQFYNVRLLGTSLTEDASGGFYGGTILRDLIALVPGLAIGTIEDGSDYTIQAIERAVRGAALDILKEVVGYYTRDWAVWEDGRFDWKTRNLDEAQWTVDLAQLTELELDASVDDLGRTAYVLYTDAASALETEATAVASDQRNPYVRQALTKDVLVSPGFPMTSNTSGQLATRIVGDIGQRPSVGGRLTLPATTVVANAVGPAAPAALIRGGDNILLTGVPVTEPFRIGRDGETLFHVAASDVDLQAGTVTLELEGQQRRTDVLLARLAATTRTLTG